MVRSDNTVVTATLVLSGLLALMPGLAAAQVPVPDDDETVLSEVGDGEEVVNYPARFFARYQPDTALDMVLQVPGFQLDDGSGERGFGVAAGNILINDRRLSAKQDLPSAILDRIPASYVDRIELIRGQVRGIDLRGEAVVANVVLVGDAPAAVRWETSVRLHEYTRAAHPELRLSLSDRWQDIDYNAGLLVVRRSHADDGYEDILDGDGDLTEERTDNLYNTNFTTEANLTAATAVGKTLVTGNTKLAFSHGDELLISRRVPTLPGGFRRNEKFGDDARTREVELGLDAERGLSPDFVGKAIVLFYHSNEDARSDQRIVVPPEDLQLFRVADSETDTTEAIGRLEFDWIGWEDHAVQANFEGAFNALDGSLVQTDDTGAGPVIVDVPGSNTRVEETRGDLLIKDTWTLGRWVVDYGLGAEVSEIRQTGDAEQTRDFFFLKPQGLLTFAPSQDRQTRLRVAREVAQLDFNDFVSTTVFRDEDLALGNPNLKPETTWVTELSHERRFGDLGVVTVTAYHHWVSDVQDLLPLTDEFEAPGNIGDGRRWGLELETTLPLGWTGLTGARLDIKARWQDSSVTDPVTGNDRVFSAGGSGFAGSPGVVFRDGLDYDYVYDIAFRQDLEAARVAWGWDIADRAQRELYKVNELDITDEDMELNAFIETTRWWGMKFRIDFTNILNFSEDRDRTLYVGRRDLSPVERRELQYYAKGKRVILSLSGSF